MYGCTYIYKENTISSEVEERILARNSTYAPTNRYCHPLLLSIHACSGKTCRTASCEYNNHEQKRTKSIKRDENRCNRSEVEISIPSVRGSGPLNSI